MAITSALPAVTSSITAATTAPSTTSTTASVSGAVDKKTIAGNFDAFLKLLTTQLKNQNPLDPLDTNQFTQQLVQFAQVEQQMKQNDQLTTLIAIEKSAQSTTALAFVGSTVAVDGQTHGPGQWQGELELHGIETGDRHGHYQKRHGADSLFQRLHDERGGAVLQLGRPRHQWRAVARRQLHNFGHWQGREWPARSGFN